jgi:hypothetical protein
MWLIASASSRQPSDEIHAERGQPVELRHADIVQSFSSSLERSCKARRISLVRIEDGLTERGGDERLSGPELQGRFSKPLPPRVVFEALRPEVEIEVRSSPHGDGRERASDGWVVLAQYRKHLR